MDHVAIDNVAAARAATEHLLSQGRTRIAAIGGQAGAPSGVAHLRRRGWEDALLAAGLPTDDAWVADIAQPEDGLFAHVR